MFSINEAALIAKEHGYGVSAGPGRSIFIARRTGPLTYGDSVALIEPEGAGHITPYADDYNAQDHMCATAIYKAARRRWHLGS